MSSTAFCSSESNLSNLARLVGDNCSSSSNLRFETAGHLLRSLSDGGLIALTLSGGADLLKRKTQVSKGKAK